MVELRPLSEREVIVNKRIRAELEGSRESRWLRGYNYIKNSVESLLMRIMAIPKVIPAVMLFFVLTSVIQFFTVLGWINPGWIPTENVSGFSLLGAFASSVLVLIGILSMRSSRAKALHWFKRAVLVNIFVTQVFLFYQSQLTAVWGLLVDFLIYLSIDYYIRHHPLKG